MNEIVLLYDLERTVKELSDEQRLIQRQEVALPVLARLHVWMEQEYPKVFPQSSIGKAIQYSLKRWKRLLTYTDNGQVNIDNNLIENAIRPIAVGRKNYLFAGSHEGARRAAMLYSFMGFCKKN